MDTFDLYVAVVAGIGSPFGSRIMTRHGILFNNDLAYTPRTPRPDTPTPHRAHTTYTPVIVTHPQQVCDSRIVLSSGTMMSMVQVLSQLLFYQHNLTQAIELPRINMKINDNIIYIQDFHNGLILRGRTRHQLQTSLNHTLGRVYPPYDSVVGVYKTKDVISSWSDGRGGGVAHRLQPVSDLTNQPNEPVAVSDLTNHPTTPTTLSDLTNQPNQPVTLTKPNVPLSDLTNQPNQPVAVSDLTNNNKPVSDLTNQPNQPVPLSDLTNQPDPTNTPLSDLTNQPDPTNTPLSDLTNQPVPLSDLTNTNPHISDLTYHPIPVSHSPNHNEPLSDLPNPPNPTISSSQPHHIPP
ncbi:hypothetical protein Pcinc_040417 [Petrolisthes cinctipes]|uniref:Uncharacterized protein n=1 Tax=Petrolisthes cinctipes TaxID=88211 RepID=A0AAE1BLM7_PETCI|nr:hypothetical protein Pcinc_040417 [Petrolisthes cinctipes]